MADTVSKHASKKADTFVTLMLEPNNHADEIELGEGATLVAGSRVRVKESTWKAAQVWLAPRPVATHISIVKE